MTERVHISVVVPTLNRPTYLRKTLSSLRVQKCEDCEFIIVDDGSDDETRGLIDEFVNLDKRFCFIEKLEAIPRGPQSSRNLGLAAARGSHIMFLDSDDLVTTNCLEKRWSVATKNPEYDIFVFPQALFSKISDSLRLVNVRSEVPDLDRFLCFAHPVDVPWVNGAAMLRVDALRDNKILWLEQFHWDDIVFHFQCLLDGLKVLWCSDQPPDCLYRIHDENNQGQLLHTNQGIENIFSMAEWMQQKLISANLANEARRKRLVVSCFHAAVLPDIDKGYSRLSKFLSALRTSRALRKNEAIRLGMFSMLRFLLRATKRGTYYWNRFCRYTILKDFFPDPSSSYASIEVVNADLESVISGIHIAAR